VSDRLTGTRLRIEKGNELYGFVATYCSLGKAAFGNTNYAKYQDYIIYDNADTPHTAPQAPQNVSFQNDVVSWTPSPTATSYKLYQSLTPSGDDWSVIDEGNDTMAIVPHIFIGGRRFRVTAHNLSGTSEPSAEVYNVASVNIPTGFMFADNQLVWHQVDWANGYYRGAIAKRHGLDRNLESKHRFHAFGITAGHMVLSFAFGLCVVCTRDYTPIVELHGGSGNVNG
jgi:hypothetical protein